MWSVVTESPSSARTRAPEMSATGEGSIGHALEVGRLADVGRVAVPLEGLASGVCMATASARVAGEDVGVLLGEVLGA
jgi:hypothetical protein